MSVIRFACSESELYPRLAGLARDAREKAYCPYSGYAVGAVLLCSERGEDGSYFAVTGCNVENASFPAGICAERTALFAAVTEGFREFSALLLCGGKAGEDPSDFCLPCGICRQALCEFCPDSLPVISSAGGEMRHFTLGGLLPEAFRSF